ncbi:hypothetical protein EVAR_99950_1 [Eumeta japonica]|uniref:Uncharacterized protein n=1 Tax=Eumeta variegata TaxID=151549 RepID=A0A4C1ZGJ3_EUMVA|nr:hypothetical protein EVAR_99950_1 [Eumeta japonica]
MDPIDGREESARHEGERVGRRGRLELRLLSQKQYECTYLKSALPKRREGRHDDWRPPGVSQSDTVRTGHGPNTHTRPVSGQPARPSTRRRSRRTRADIE